MAPRISRVARRLLNVSVAIVVTWALGYAVNLTLWGLWLHAQSSYKHMPLSVPTSTPPPHHHSPLPAS